MTKIYAEDTAVLDDGTYEGVVEGIEIKKSKNGEDFLVWSVRASGQKVTGASSPKITGGTKSARWIEAVIGRKPRPGEEFDTDAVVGLPCLIDVLINENGYSRIEEIRNARRVRPSRPPMNMAPPPEPEYEGEIEDEDDLTD